MPERELGAAAAGVKDDQRAIWQTQPGLRGKVGQPALLLARNDLDRNPRSSSNCFDDRRTVAGDPQAGRANGNDRPHAAALCLAAHVRDRVRGPLRCFGRDLTGLLEALAQTRHLGAIDDRAPRSGAVTLADMQLDRVRADVDHRVPLRHVVEQRLAGPDA